jgi:type IV pilus assembly protein PilA
MDKNNKKGFTLAELLIVVAIIGVLVAISIPIFTSQLEKAREATDAANIRSAYAEVVAAALTDDTHDHSATVNITQREKSNWISEGNIAGVALSNIDVSGGTVTIAYTANDGKVKIAGQEANTNAGVS